MSMISNSKKLVLTLSILTLAAISPGCFEAAAEPADRMDGQGLTGAVEAAELTSEEAAHLIFMREEEKLARDVYITLYDQWGMRVFFNIAGAEQRHMDAMGELLAQFDLPDPVGDDQPGQFANAQLQQLHDDLVAAGSSSMEDAFRVGALIEETDIVDIQAAMAETTNPDVLAAYQALICGSRNHLRAFNRQLEREGVGYEPQVLDVYEFSSIIDADNERCFATVEGDGFSRRGDGSESGRGNGNRDGRGYGSRRGGDGYGRCNR